MLLVYGHLKASRHFTKQPAVPSNTWQIHTDNRHIDMLHFWLMVGHGESRLDVHRHFFLACDDRELNHPSSLWPCCISWKSTECSDRHQWQSMALPEVQSVVENCYFKLLNNSNGGHSLSCMLPSCMLIFTFQLYFHLLHCMKIKTEQRGHCSQQCHPLSVGKL